MNSPTADRTYRPDIDGLRAIAVLAVVTYHFFPSLLPGGFTGVDVFFVISGYLITGIIRSQLAAGTFSLWDFYLRRARRILPSLALVLAASAAVGFTLLYADEFALLGKHIAAAATFSTNFVLWSEVGYFDAGAEAKPLLHLWSLAVEEQYYLVWPALFAFACRSERARLALVASVLVASLLACVWITPSQPAAAFYLPMYRVWELMAGALLAVRPGLCATSARDSAVRSWLGAAFIGLSLFLLQPGSEFPGWRALLPVLGAGLLISAGSHGWLQRRVLASRPLVAVGLVSYPLYLWHWPLLVFLKYANNLAELTPARAAVLFIASLLLATLSYLLVERPIRFGRWSGAKTGLALSALVAVGVAGAVVMQRQGLPERPLNARDTTFPARDGRNATDIAAWVTAGCGLPPDEAAIFRRCTHDVRGPSRYVLIGDSKAEALWAGLVRTSDDRGRWMFIGGSTAHSSVLPVISPAWHYQSYQQPSQLALATIAADPQVDTVVIAAAARALFHLARVDTMDDLPSSPFYADAHAGFTAYVRRLTAAGKRVVLVADNPALPDPKRCMTNARVDFSGPVARFLALGEPDPRCDLPLDSARRQMQPYRRLLESVREVAPSRIAIFETDPILCDAARNRCSVFDGATSLYGFADHVSDEASTRIGRALNGFLAARPR